MIRRALGFGAMLAVTTAVALVLWLGWTSSGLRWLLARGGDMVPGKLEITEISGRLADSMQFGSLRYQDETTALSVDQLVLQWTPSALLRGRLELNLVYGQDITLRRTPTEEKTGLTDLDLPIPVTLHHGELRNLVIEGEGTDPLQVDQAIAAGEVGNRRVTLNRFEVRVGDRTLTASGHVLPYGNYQMDFQTRWQAVIAGPQLQGDGRVSGDLQKLRVTQRVASGGSALIDLELADLLADLRWGGTLEAQAFTLPDEWNRYGLGPSTGSFSGQGTGKRAALQGKLTTAYGDIEKLELELDGAYDNGNVAITRLFITEPQRQSELTASGNITDVTGSTGFDLSASWRNLGWPLGGAAQWNSATGNARLTGNLERYDLNAQFAAAGHQLPPGHWSITGAGERSHVALNTVTGKLLGGTVEGAAGLNWDNDLQWSATIRARDLNPASYWGRWPGKLAAELAGTGEVTGSVSRYDINLKMLEGSLRQRKISGSGALSHDGDSLSLRNIQLNSGKSAVNANGDIGARMNLVASVHSPDLADLWPGAAGRLKLDGTVRGTRNQPGIELTVDAATLEFEGLRLGRLQGSVAAGLAANSQWRLQLDAASLLYAGQQFDQLAIESNGITGDHKWTVRATRKDVASVLVEASGGLAGSHWRGNLQRVDIAGTAGGDWALSRPVALDLPRAASPRVAGACLNNHDGRLCINGVADGDTVTRYQLTLERFPLELLSGLLPRPFSAAGRIDGDASVSTDRWKVASAKARLDTSDTTLRSTPAGGTPETVAFTRLGLETEYGPGATRVAVSAALGDADRIDGQLTITHHPGQDDWRRHPVKGSLRGRVGNLRWLEWLYPRVDDVSGLLEVDAEVLGTARRPLLRGRGSLVNAGLSLPDIGIRLRQLSIELGGDGSDTSVTASVLSGEGSLKAAGRYRPAADGDLVLRIEGERFEVVNTSGFHVMASPRLDLHMNEEQIEVQGSVDIPRARITPHTPLPGAGVSRDVVVINAPPDSGFNNRGLPVKARLAVTLGDAVNFDGFGIHGRLTGQLDLVDEPDSITTATGELALADARYSVYGRNLTIDPGRLIFAGGAVDNPGVDARAIRKVGENLAGVQIRGTLRSPEMSLFSEPAMREAETLSLLLLGRPLNQAGSSDGTTLLAATGALGLGQGGRLSQEVISMFGLEQFSVGADPATGTGAALSLGKYLSPRLYISYMVGVLEPLTSLHARYQMTDRWVLQADSSPRGSGADVLFTLER